MTVTVSRQLYISCSCFAADICKKRISNNKSIFFTKDFFPSGILLELLLNSKFRDINHHMYTVVTRADSIANPIVTVVMIEHIMCYDILNQSSVTGIMSP